MTDETANRRLEPFLLCNGLIVVLEIWRDFPKDQIEKNLWHHSPRQYHVCSVLPICEVATGTLTDR